MSLRILSPILIVGSALLLIALERRFPYEPRQKLFREGFFTDLIGYGLVQSYFLGLLISGFIVYLDQHTGWSKYRIVGGWPIALQCFFFFVTHDFYIYWFHRLQHYSPTLWKIHEAHHSVDDVDWLSGTRSHVLEIIINQTIEFAPIVLLGADPRVAIFKATLDAVWGMFIHSNLDVRLGRLQYVFNGPEYHRWHHAREIPMPGRNYGTKLAIWDHWFGTVYHPPFKPARYGLDELAYPKRGFWAYLMQHAYSVPFLARRLQVRATAQVQPAGTHSEG